MIQMIPLVTFDAKFHISPTKPVVFTPALTGTTIECQARQTIPAKSIGHAQTTWG